MKGDRVAVESTWAVPMEEILKEGVRQAPDVSGLAAVEGKRVMVMVWHYHDDDVTGAAGEDFK